MSFNYGGYSHVGYKRETNQDFMDCKPFGQNILLAIVSDGKGSEPGCALCPHPRLQRPGQKPAALLP